ncbi:MAG: hypothetical protein KDC98_02940 [Planctomycetes bacterium]|nr:hypothetical protein [Planctomycetota bacterium]
MGRRIRGAHLAAFLADPGSVEPGTTMPGLLRELDPARRDDAARALSEYLKSFASPVAAAATEPDDGEAVTRGGKLYHGIGCVACHAPRHEQRGDLVLAEAVPLGDLAAKYRPDALRAFLLAPHDARPAARMPDFSLSPAEAHDLASFLLASGATDSRSPAEAPPLAAAAKAAIVEVGRRLFAARGCAGCHALADADRPAAPVAARLADLDPSRGCLSGDVGPWPYYPLSPRQRGDLRAALAGLDGELDDATRIRQLLATRNCLACHRRGEAGGVTAERNGYFVSSDPTLGEDGRLPPALTAIGAKLQADWLRDAIAHGQSERPYLRTRMPGFGVDFASELSALLEKTDRLPGPARVESFALPDNEQAAKAVIDLGRELVSDKGMNCIACHDFAGETAGAMAAIDLVASTGRRLRPQWFAHYLRDPLAWKPGTLMPQFFPSGVSIRPDLGAGDAAKQIAAMWHYLAEGRNVRQPSGMRRPPIELTIDREAVMLRRSAPDTGKRAISVGYPTGVNLTFDAERLGLDRIWWGGFLDAASVWTGQGSGRVRILGEQRVALPNGPAFAALADTDQPWPQQTRRELGQRWLGYDLDAEQRPSFRYVCEGVTITDTPRELPVVAAESRLQRTLALASTVDKTLYFRAARAAWVEDRGDGTFDVDDSLRLRLETPATAAIVRADGEQQELIVPIPIRSGRAELVLVYELRRTGR